MDAGLGTQPTVCVITAHAHRRSLDTRHFAVALVDDLGLDAVCVRPLQVHSQQHRSPVLSLGAAGAGLDVEEGTVRIHLAGKHALEFQALDLPSELCDVGFDLGGRAGVGLRLRELQQFCAIAQTARQLIQSIDDGVELSALPAKFLRPCWIVPDRGLLEFTSYFLSTFLLVVVIKDTSSRNRCAPRDL